MNNTFEENREISSESLRILMKDLVRDEIHELLRNEIKNHPSLKPLLITIIYDEIGELIADIARGRGSVKNQEEFDKVKESESKRSAARLAELFGV